MLVSAADRAEILRHVREAEASGRAGHPLVRLLRRIALPEDAITVTLPPQLEAPKPMVVDAETGEILEGA